MSPAPKRAAKPPPPPKRWQRAGAGRHRSSDGRFELESGGGSWFVTDQETLDELGLARTSGPFPTLAAAKAAADEARSGPAEASPLAARIAEAASRARPEPKAGSKAKAAPPSTAAHEPRPDAHGGPGRGFAAEPGDASPPIREPEPAPRSWLDDLGESDRELAIRARRLTAALEQDGVTDADSLVRRDLLGGTPAIATRLLARTVIASLAVLKNPTAADLVAAVADAMASSPKHAGLPGWELTERDGPKGERRSLRLTPDDLRAAAENEADG